MRIDKLTTKFQQALADAQSLALANDSGFIEPQHLLLALLNQDDGGTASLLQRAGVNVPPLKKALEDSIKRLPKVEGQEGEMTSRAPQLFLNLTDKKPPARRPVPSYSELFPHSAVGTKGEPAAAQAAWREPGSRTPSGRSATRPCRCRAEPARSAENTIDLTGRARAAQSSFGRDEKSAA
jgi:ATP-dependent Clp protease ATP-binding subunit ClpB